ncbi:MAG: polysaccharide deacetylase family protein [bacterium]|nr:polysaccharide deacetylase family protein [bacterium]
MNTIPILTFHSIDASGSVISMAPARFRQLLYTLKQQGYHSVSLTDVMQWLSEEKTLPAPCVVITFDDGFQNLYAHAFPVLAELGFTATLFLTTGYCGQYNAWRTRFSDIPRLPMLTWEQIEEMAQSLFDVQAHSRTHPFLFTLNAEQMNDELVGSKHEIEDRVGKSVDFFAYPYGFFHKNEDLPVRRIFQGACSTNLRAASRTSDRYLLPRIDMYYFSHRVTSNIFLSPLCAPYLCVRRFLRHLRQARRKAVDGNEVLLNRFEIFRRIL